MLSAWAMVEPKQVQRRELILPELPQDGWVRVEVAGCGVCHTDLGYLYGGIPTKKQLPLVLGHEISGVVRGVGVGAEEWMNRRVIVPAVIPCGECVFCRRGRRTSCRAALMPGNDFDGGFASALDVPARSLCDVDAGQWPNGRIGRAKLELWELAVVADAVATPLQAVRRSGLAMGELAIFIGAGGVGTFGLQIAKAFGAIPLAVDVSEARRTRATKFGALAAFDGGAPPKEVKAAVRAFVREQRLPEWGWRIFETSGNPRGQELAFDLLSPAGSLSVVGFSKERVTVSLSRLMALDATAYGNWGADPELYPEALRLVASGEVQLRGLVRRFPLDEAAAVLEAAHAGEIAERPVLVPRPTEET